MRRRPAIVLAAVALAAAAGPVEGAAGRGVGPREVDVMTWNVASARLTGGDLEPLAATIEAADPDVVAVQELDRSWSRTGGVDQPALLAARLGMSYVWDSNYDCRRRDTDDDDRCEYGTAIFTRLPIDSASVRRYGLPTGGEPETRGLTRATVRVDGRPLEVFNTHLGLRPATRRAQIYRLVNLVGTAPRPLVVLGDFNTPPFAPEAKPLFRRFGDVQAIGGYRFQRTTASSRIDYVFASRRMEVFGARVLPTRHSDHRPVVAELRLPR